MLTKFTLLKRRPNLSSARFSPYWRTTHANDIVEQGGHKTCNKRYAQSHCLRDIGLDLGSQAFDGGELKAQSPAEFTAFLRRHSQLQGKGIRRASIKLD
jgi:hypothetical protein